MEKQNEKEEVEAFCPECGHAFKTYMDRVLHSVGDAPEEQKAECPVCGCGRCRIGETGA